jgi:septum formation protein
MGPLAVAAITPERPLILGSASPRRRELLSGLGLSLLIRPADIDEDRKPSERALEYLERIVADKLAAVARGPTAGVAGILVADTIVVLDGEVLGKPRDVQDAAALLTRLAGRTHTVYTRYALAHSDSGNRAAAARTVESFVQLRAAEPDELVRYAATGEGLDKAGAYAVQGIGAFLVETIDGSYTNVVGLPVCEVVLDLKRIGLLERFP